MLTQTILDYKINVNHSGGLDTLLQKVICNVASIEHHNCVSE